MTLYVDSNTFLKVYLDEPESDAAAALLAGDRWTSARHTLVEIRRNLVRALEGDALESARRQFTSDWDSVNVIEVGKRTCALAADLAERTGIRTLDALHLGAAASLEIAVPFVTFDRRLAGAARSLGWTVLGV